MIYTKTPKQIEKETGRRFVDICKELISEGLSPTEIAQKLHLRGSDPVQASLYKERLADKRNILFPEFVDQSTKDLIALCPKVIGIEYKDFIHQKYIIDGMSAAQIASIIGQNEKKIERHIKSFGFSKTPAQARKDSVRSGVINYQQIVANSRKTRRKSNSFSNSQDMVRYMFKSHIERIISNLNIIEIEVILGFDEMGILGDKEVDIPIVIFKGESTYKFSIELNGEYVHSTNRAIQRDDEKAVRLKAKGWLHFIITYSQSNAKIEEQVIIILEQIFGIVLNRNFKINFNGL
ncbi:hypothetical protein ABE504_32890 [Paenibacillus oryzisoli]|uniref:hypothetical protein n=1 Tax=Paenibacillus oryzisoli TaxID=1850517 RepID=UPI003D2D350D